MLNISKIANIVNLCYNKRVDLFNKQVRSTDIMENVNEDKKIGKFSSKQMAVIEWVLVREIDALQENPRRHQIKRMIQNNFIQFCFEKNYSVSDVFEVVSPLIRKDVKIELKDIVPESEKGQNFLVRGTFAGILNRSGAIWDERKTEEAIDRFCNITGISKDFVVPRINTFVKQRKREILETELVETLQKLVVPIEDKSERLKKGNLVISEFARVLNLEPKYVKGVLRQKKKKDETEKKKKLPDNPDDNIER
jgi:hypothetical protein